MLYSTLTRQSIIQLVSKAFATLVGLAVVGIMARGLGPAGFGEYTAIVTFLQFAGILADLGLTMTAGRALGQSLTDKRELMGNVLSFRVTTAAFAFALAPLFALALPYPPIVKTGIALTSVALFLSSVSSTIGAIFQAELKSGWLAATEIGGRLVLLAGTALAFYRGSGLVAYLWALTASATIAMAITWVGAQRYIPHTWRIDTVVWRTLWRDTWPLAITIILNLAYFRTDVILLSLIRPVTEVGLYGASYRLLEVLLTIPAIVGGLVLPLAAGFFVRQERDKLSELYRGSFDALASLGLAGVVASAAIGVPLMTALAGADFKIAGQLLLPVSVAAAGAFAAGAAGYIIYSMGLQRDMIRYYLSAAIVAVAGYIILIPHYSYWAAAWITAAVNVAMAIAGVIMLYRHGVTLSTKRWAKLLVPLALLAGGLALPLPLAAKLMTGGGLWLAALWKMQLIPSARRVL